MKNFEETQQRITLHGLGFIQLQLEGGQRLHVWHPSLPRRKCYEESFIHDHRFSFESTVLVGSLVNRVYVKVRMSPSSMRGQELSLVIDLGSLIIQLVLNSGMNKSWNQGRRIA